MHFFKYLGLIIIGLVISGCVVQTYQATGYPVNKQSTLSYTAPSNNILLIIDGIDIKGWWDRDNYQNIERNILNHSKINLSNFDVILADENFILNKTIHKKRYSALIIINRFNDDSKASESHAATINAYTPDGTIFLSKKVEKTLKTYEVKILGRAGGEEVIKDAINFLKSKKAYIEDKNFSLTQINDYIGNNKYLDLSFARLLDIEGFSRRTDKKKIAEGYYPSAPIETIMRNLAPDFSLWYAVQSSKSNSIGNILPFLNLPSSIEDSHINLYEKMLSINNAGSVIDFFKPILEQDDYAGSDFLQRAIEQNSRNSFAKLLHLGVNDEKLSKFTGLAPIHGAIKTLLKKQGNSYLEYLISRGRDINTMSSRGETGLTEAIKDHVYIYSEDLNSLLNRGLDINLAGKPSLKTSLMMASEIKNSELIKQLINFKADISRKDKKGRTALFYAFPEPDKILDTGHKSIISYLVDNGANPALRDNTGLTASELYGKRRNEFLIAKAKAEEAERQRLANIEADRRQEELRRQEQYIAQQKREQRERQEQARKDEMIKNTIIGMGNIIAEGIKEAGAIENQMIAETNRIYAAQQSYNDNVRANQEKRERDAQQFEQERQQRIREGEAFAAQQSAEWNSFQKELEQKYSSSNKTVTTASNTNSDSGNNIYDETNSSENMNSNFTEKDTRIKYVAKRVEVNTSGGAWDTKERAFEWLRETVSSNQIRRACDLTRIVPLDLQNVTYRKTGSGRFHAKGTALGYCEIPSSSSKYKNIGWCSTKGFNFSERHSCALPNPM